MRFSCLSLFRQHLFAGLAAGASLGWPLASHALAEAAIRQSNGIERKGEITGVRNGNVMIQFGPGEIGVPLAEIASVSMAPPTAALRGLELQETGKPAEALAVLQPLVEQFGGLPLDWAQRAAAAIGDLYLSLDQTAGAAAAYAKLQQLYPGAAFSLQAEIGLARVAAAENKLEEARTVLAPLVAGALTKKELTKAESAAFGQACFTLGNIAEKEGKPAEALEDYLRTVTIFYADRATAARAQEHADALRKNGSIAVP